MYCRNSNSKSVCRKANRVGKFNTLKLEKLSLEKFQDVKLDNKQLYFVNVGYTYDSDSIDYCGYTNYSGVKNGWFC